jgi:hypothetical protein
MTDCKIAFHQGHGSWLYRLKAWLGLANTRITMKDGTVLRCCFSQAILGVTTNDDGWPQVCSLEWNQPRHVPTTKMAFLDVSRIQAVELT